MTLRGALGAFALLLAVMAPAPPARAQGYAPPTAGALETARTLYNKGRELRAGGDLRGALEKFQAAHALGNTPVTGIELARTYAMLGQLVEARETALSIARIPVASDEGDKSADARTEAPKLADDLRPRIPTLLVKLAGLAPGEKARLLIDDVAIPAAAMGEPQKVNPGRHELVARAGEGSAARQVRGPVEVKEGETREVELVLPSPQGPPAAAGGTPSAPEAGAQPANKAEEQPPPHASGGMPTLARVGFGTAIVGAVVGLVAGTTALTKKDQAAGECPGYQCPAGQLGESDLHAAQGWATAANVSFAVAGAAAVVGVLSLAIGGKSGARPAKTSVQVSPWVGVGAAGLHASF